jgi:hypothetical protein
LGVGLTTPPCNTWICLETSTETSEEEESWEGRGLKTGRSAIEEEEDNYMHKLLQRAVNSVFI